MKRGLPARALLPCGLVIAVACHRMARPPDAPVAKDAPFVAEGGKLVGSGAVGAAGQGTSVAISADGGTVVAGGASDDSRAGAAWVFERGGAVWGQQGNKLVGSGADGNAGQGASVAVSADGNTLLVGGPGDKLGTGAAWVFSRRGAVWSQQGGKLAGKGAGTSGYLGSSVAISADGSTAIVGGSGGAWVFTRTGEAWSQRDDRLFGSGAVGEARLGTSVAISGDGNEAIVGGPVDNQGAGAAWVFSRRAGVWTQHGNKLVGTGAAGRSAVFWQGEAVAISRDANTALVGGAGDVWVFTRRDGEYSQQGSALIGVRARTDEGRSVAISGDGSTIVVGGAAPEAGAARVYSRRKDAWSQLAIRPSHQGKVAISSDGRFAVVGVPEDDRKAGAVWVYTRGGGKPPAPNQPPPPRASGAAAETAVPRATEPREDVKWVRIPAGTFTMGCTAGDAGCNYDEEQPHVVRFTRGFEMAATSTTNGQYDTCVRWGPCLLPPGRPFGDPATSEHPVVNVNAVEAEKFCKWLGGRLPTEAEWEYAARGGREGSKYPWGNSVSRENANYGKDQCCGGFAQGRDAWVETSPVRSFEANGFGLFDMAGNVLQWTSDLYDPNFWGKEPRMLRGGSWWFGPEQARVSHREKSVSYTRSPSIGFRCTRDSTGP